MTRQSINHKFYGEKPLNLVGSVADLSRRLNRTAHNVTNHGKGQRLSDLAAAIEW
jgi:hypothetical protein